MSSIINAYRGTINDRVAGHVDKAVITELGLRYMTLIQLYLDYGKEMA